MPFASPSALWWWPPSSRRFRIPPTALSPSFAKSDMWATTASLSPRFIAPIAACRWPSRIVFTIPFSAALVARIESAIALYASTAGFVVSCANERRAIAATARQMCVRFMGPPWARDSTRREAPDLPAPPHRGRQRRRAAEAHLRALDRRERVHRVHDPLPRHRGRRVDLVRVARAERLEQRRQPLRGRRDVLAERVGVLAPVP